MSRTIDFDAFRRERVGEPLSLVIGGEAIELPAELPAVVALDLLRMKREMGEDKEVPPEAMEQMGAALFGAERFRSLIERNGLSLPELGTLITRVLAAYGAGADADPPGPARTQEPGSASSSDGP